MGNYIVGNNVPIIIILTFHLLPLVYILCSVPPVYRSVYFLTGFLLGLYVSIDMSNKIY